MQLALISTVVAVSGWLARPEVELLDRFIALAAGLMGCVCCKL